MPDEPSASLSKGSPAPAQVGDANTAPRTTAEQDMVTAGQRKVNLLWENTQQYVALSVTWVALLVAAFLAIGATDNSVKTASMVFLFGVANLVIGFYFGRTNHQKIGGVSSGYDGR